MSKLEEILKLKNKSCYWLAKQLKKSTATVLSRKKHGIKNISTAKEYAVFLDVDPIELIER
ncbi:hypothetical protein AAEX28_12375 [Lentisphaerota bacterium WC36G]|nr:hypothetical protein LJT99_15205 [Lentisphaerae bacterium WC36]